MTTPTRPAWLRPAHRWSGIAFPLLGLAIFLAMLLIPMAVGPSPLAQAQTMNKPNNCHPMTTLIDKANWDNDQGAFVWEGDGATYISIHDVILDEDNEPTEAQFTLIHPDASVAFVHVKHGIDDTTFTFYPPLVQGDTETFDNGGDQQAISNVSFCKPNVNVIIEKTLDEPPDPPAGPGEIITFTVSLTNTGTVVAPDVWIWDNLEPELKFISSDPGEPTCTAYDDPGDQGEWGGEIVVCEFGDMPPGSSEIVKIAVQVDPAIVDVVTIENQACYYFGDNPDHFDCAAATVTVPVTLASFKASRSGGDVRIEWSTATETGNVGFNLYAVIDGETRKLNETLILSEAFNGLDGTNYSFVAEDLNALTFYVEDVSIRGQAEQYGPFTLGKSYGAAVEQEAIDWSAIAAEHEAKADARSAAAAVDVQSRINQMLSGPESLASGRISQLQVSETGIYRLSHADLLVAGIDLSGVAAGDIALVNQGTPVAITVGGGNTWGANSYVEFYGEALESLYSQTNVYMLYVDSALARRVDEDNAAPSGTPAAFYMETVEAAQDNRYEVTSPLASPWYDSRLVASDGPSANSFTVEVDNYVAGAATVRLNATFWGSSMFDAYPDHHLVAEVGGTPVADVTFDALSSYTLDIGLAEGVLQEGANTITLRLPHDLGQKWDVINVDSYGFTYPRAFVARDSRLAFTAEAGAFQVMGLDSADAFVYRLDENGVSRLNNLTVAANGGGYQVTFAGNNAEASYAVATAETLLKPVIAPARQPADITSGTAQYLMIAHPDFIDGLDPLVSFHRSRGLDVRVVNVENVYDQFSYGVFDAQAIADYLVHAHANMGTEYVLLVGGDNYDYHNNLGQNAISFIPSLYATTGPIVRYAPVDPKYADVDGDDVPDLKLGRFPVRTSAELDAIVGKTITYMTTPRTLDAVYTADVADGIFSFANHSEEVIGQLPSDWAVTRAYLDEMSVDDARQVLIDQLNSGVALAHFIGHSSYSQWTWQGLFTSADAEALTNAGKPTIVTQYGCWNTYYVSPNFNTLGHTLMLSGDQGAAAVLGSSTLTELASEERLGALLTAQLTQPGITLGQAMVAAKAELEQSYPDLLDVQLGWTLLGDPALALPVPSQPTSVNLTSVSASTEGATMSPALLVNIALILLTVVTLIGRLLLRKRAEFN